MVTINVRSLDFSEIVEQLRKVLEASSENESTGARVLTSQTLERVLDGCDDPDHAREPLAQAVYEFILAHEASVVVMR